MFVGRSLLLSFDQSLTGRNETQSERAFRNQWKQTECNTQVATVRDRRKSEIPAYLQKERKKSFVF